MRSAFLKEHANFIATDIARISVIRRLMLQRLQSQQRSWHLRFFQEF